MKVRLRYMVQDPLISAAKGMTPTEGFDTDRETFLLDGPVTRRVAVLDFDEAGRALRPGARYQPPPPGRKLGRYHVDDESAFTASDFLQVSVFATVLKTIYMYEEEDTLGREITWGFDGPQLLVVPRAGVRTNAFYERASHSLQFFHFPSMREARRGETVYTCLSHDIVSHETGHAILDGIAPDLYNAITPQSLALHEAVADLTALIMAFRSRTLRETVLSQTGGSIRGATAFSWLAEEFGREQDPEGRAGYLRSLLNDKTLDPADESRDELGRPNRVSRSIPHELSQVLSGAMAEVVVNAHEAEKRRQIERSGGNEFSVSGKALFIAAERFKRMLIRGLDYLPPGEVSFADLARAILASDQSSHPGGSQERDWLIEQLVTRHVVEDAAELAVKTSFSHEAVENLDLATLVESDWAAYDFANRHRSLLGIPERVHFRMRPRLKVTKLYYHREGKRRVTECLFKVSWDREEENPGGARLTRRRQITVGTTLAIDWETRMVRALLRAEAGLADRDEDPQKRDRDALLRRLVAEGRLSFGAPSPDEGSAGVWAEAMGDVMRVRGAARMLHVAAEET